MNCRAVSLEQWNRRVRALVQELRETMWQKHLELLRLLGLGALYEAKRAHGDRVGRLRRLAHGSIAHWRHGSASMMAIRTSASSTFWRPPRCQAQASRGSSVARISWARAAWRALRATRRYESGWTPVGGWTALAGRVVVMLSLGDELVSSSSVIASTRMSSVITFKDRNREHLRRIVAGDGVDVRLAPTLHAQGRRLTATPGDNPPRSRSLFTLVRG